MVHCIRDNPSSTYRVSGQTEIPEITEPQEINAPLSEVTVVPNPVTDIVKLSSPLFSQNEVKLSIIDLAGKVVQQSQQRPDASGFIQVSVAGLPPAFYSIKLEDGAQVLYGKMIKQ
jgi:hypothetical protein